MRAERRNYLRAQTWITPWLIWESENIAHWSSKPTFSVHTAANALLRSSSTNISITTEKKWEYQRIPSHWQKKTMCVFLCSCCLYQCRKTVPCHTNLRVTFSNTGNWMKLPEVITQRLPVSVYGPGKPFHSIWFTLPQWCFRTLVPNLFSKRSLHSTSTPPFMSLLCANFQLDVI